MNRFIYKKKSLFSVLYTFILLCACICSLTSFFLYHYYLPIVFNTYNNDKKIVYLDRNGIAIESNKKHSERAFFSQLNNYTIYSFLAAEDRNFFSHRGISLPGIIRSLLINIRHRKFLQGASTITQQYIKLLTKESKKTIVRKIYEQIKALIIESNHTKEEILEGYLNVLYFGHKIIGLAQASKAIWGIPYQKLSLAQAATLAGIIQNPRQFNPWKYQSHCIQRRNVILERMKRFGFINEIEYHNACKEPLIIASHKECDWAIHCIGHVNSLIKKNSIQKDSHHMIYTTYDAEIQKKICLIINNHMEKLQHILPEIECGAAIYDNDLQTVVAVYNGSKYHLNDTVRCIARRQVGSIIKPLITYYALQNGDTMSTIYEDEPINIHGWKPCNYNKKFNGSMTISDALIQSNNIVLIKILDKYGVNNFCNILHDNNLFGPVYPYISLALGCFESDAITNVFYAGLFSRQGTYKKQSIIKRIIDDRHRIIFKPSKPLTSYFDNNLIKEVQSAMEIIGERLKTINNINSSISIRAKTGTTDKAKTCWFIGSNNRYSIALYIGTDNQLSLSPYKITSIRSASSIGLDILTHI